MPTISEQLPVAPEKAAPKKIERFGQTVLSPDDIRGLKEQVEETLASREQNSVYKAIDQLSHLKSAGVQGFSVRLNREKLTQQREQLQKDPQTLAKYLVRMKYLGLVDTEKVVDITDQEKSSIQARINERLAENDTRNFAELCVSAKHLGIEISQEALGAIRAETEALLANNPHGSEVDTYVKRRAQARYLDITLSDDQELETTTKQRLAEHQNGSKWDQYAHLQALYTRATKQSFPLNEITRDSLVKHTATLKSDPAKVGRYLSDLKVIEQVLPTGVPDAQPVGAEATVEVPVSGGDTVEEAIITKPETQEQVSVIVKDGLESPFFVKTPNGEVGCGTDEGVGYGGVNEDAIVVNQGTNDFVVIDGMGGPGRGDEAAGILAESFKGGFAAGDSYADIQQEAHKRMKERGLRESGAVFVAGRIRGAELQGTLVGDCRLVVIRDGKIVFATEDKGSPPPFHNKVSNPITGEDPGQMHGFIFKLQEGDRIIAGSDGLFESVAGYAETFNRIYWNKIKKQFSDNNEVVTAADRALSVLDNKEGDNRDSDVYQQVKKLRPYLNGSLDYIKKLQATGAVVADNQNAKLLSLVKGQDLKDALRILERQTNLNMQSGRGKKDNRSILIYDIERVTLPQAIPGEEPPAAATEIPEATPVAEEQPSVPEPEPSLGVAGGTDALESGADIPSAAESVPEGEGARTEIEEFEERLAAMSEAEVRGLALEKVRELINFDYKSDADEEVLVRHSIMQKLVKSSDYLRELVQPETTEDLDVYNFGEKLPSKIAYHLKTFEKEYKREGPPEHLSKQYVKLLLESHLLLKKLFRRPSKRAKRLS